MSQYVYHLPFLFFSSQLVQASPAPKVGKDSAPSEKADSATVAQLRSELAQFEKKLVAMEAAFNDRIEALESQLDEHKVQRVMLQVELERLTRRANRT